MSIVEEKERGNVEVVTRTLQPQPLQLPLDPLTLLILLPFLPLIYLAQVLVSLQQVQMPRGWRRTLIRDSQGRIIEEEFTLF